MGGKHRFWKKKSSSGPGDFSNPKFLSINRQVLFEEEKIPSYDPEEFCPIQIGQTCRSKYQVVGKLGYGGSSTVWLCRNLNDDRYDVLKVITYKYDDPGWTYREINILSHVKAIMSRHSGQKCIRELLDSFEIRGIYGSHSCLILPVMDMSLADMISANPVPFPVHLLKVVLRRLLSGLDFLHTKAGVVHCDLRAENIMLPVGSESVLRDFEDFELANPSARKIISESRIIYESRELNASSDEMWDECLLCDFSAAKIGKAQRPDHEVQPAPYRAPEVALEMPWGPPADIWNLGTLAWHLLEGQPLFSNPDSVDTGKGKGKESEHSSVTAFDSTSLVEYLSQIVAVMGIPSQAFVSRSEAALECFDRNIENWVPIIDAKMTRPTLGDQEMRLSCDDKVSFLQFIRSTLTWLPEERKTAKELLGDPWLDSGVI